MNPGADDSQSTLASIEDLYYHDGCLYPSSDVMIFKLCPDGGIGDVQDDDDSVSPALIATSTLCGVLGVGLIGAGFYIYQFQQTLEGSKAALDHELVEVDDAEMEA